MLSFDHLIFFWPCFFWANTNHLFVMMWRRRRSSSSVNLLLLRSFRCGNYWSIFRVLFTPSCSMQFQRQKCCQMSMVPLAVFLLCYSVMASAETCGVSGREPRRPNAAIRFCSMFQSLSCCDPAIDSEIQGYYNDMIGELIQCVII